MVKHVLKALRFVINVPIYGQRVLCIFGNTPEQAYNVAINQGCGEGAAESLRSLTEDRLCGLSVRDNETGWFILYAGRLPIDANGYSIVTHECFHITEFIMERVGIRYSAKHSSEAFAYVLDFLTKAIFESLIEAADYKRINK